MVDFGWWLEGSPFAAIGWLLTSLIVTAVGRIEEGRGASRPCSLSAHQTGRADFQHPAFRQTSCDAHAGQRRTIRIR